MSTEAPVKPAYAVRTSQGVLHLPRPPHRTYTFCGVAINGRLWTAAPAQPKPTDDRCHKCWQDHR